jgi:hypothetical protein
VVSHPSGHGESLSGYAQLPFEHVPLTSNWRDVFPSGQKGSGGVLQSSGVPAHAPATLQVSTDVHGSASSQPAPNGLSGYPQIPRVHKPGSTWHESGGSSQVIPIHGSAAHKPELGSQPAGQGVSVVTNVQFPVAGEHVPPDCAREALPTHDGGGGTQTTVDPPHAPLPSHSSLVVQASPSSQELPCVLNAYEHAPPTGLHTPVVS